MAKKESTRLRYVGPAPDGFVALPEGWQAADHDEPDERVRSEKLASGMYESSTINTAPEAAEE